MDGERPLPALTRDQIRRFEQLLRRELERAQIERTQSIPPSRPLNELDRALPSGPLQDLAAVHRVVAQLRRRLKTSGEEHRGRKRRAPPPPRPAAGARGPGGARAGRPGGGGGTGPPGPRRGGGRIFSSGSAPP